MELNEYQKKAWETCLPESANFAYMMLNLVGEVGEFASKVAKQIRKNKMMVGRNGYHNGKNQLWTNYESLDEFHEQTMLLKKEAGDIAWQLAGLCNVMGWSLEEVCQMNLDKLSKRKEVGTIDGDGDCREQGEGDGTAKQRRTEQKPSADTLGTVTEKDAVVRYIEEKEK